MYLQQVHLGHYNYYLQCKTKQNKYSPNSGKWDSYNIISSVKNC